MRLTLRTMLAYLDDILEPEDSEDISKKIEESEFASNLVHRTRDCMRRLRLGVPALTGRGLGADPNTVAEYLDNTLSTDRVPEFEKICLESDVHLAEVASAHQILTLVLGEPAEIDPESRQRMYRLATQADAPPVQRETLLSSSPAAVPPAVPPVSRRVKPEVPDYLRESRTNWWPVAAMVLIAAGLMLGGLSLFGSPELREKALALIGKSDRAEAPAPAGRETQAPPFDPSEVAGNPPTEMVAPPEPTSEPDPTALANEPNSGNEPTALPLVQTPLVASPPGTLPSSTLQSSTLPADGANEPASNPLSSNPFTPQSIDPFAPPAPEPEERGVGNPREMSMPARGAGAADASEDLAVPLGPRSLPPVSDVNVPDAFPIAPEPGAVNTTPARPTNDNAVDRQQPQEGFGRLTSPKSEILLKYEPGARDWKRMASLSPLSKGDRLMSLPLYQPQLMLSSGITIKTEGAAQLDLVGWTDAGAPIIQVDFGRLWLATVGKAGNSLQLILGDTPLELTFVDAESMLAVEVRHALPPGADPTEGAPVVADFYGATGLCRLRGENLSQDIEARTHLMFAGGRADFHQGKFPEWVTNETVPSTDQQAKALLEAQFVADRSASAILGDLLMQKEQVTARRVEVRSLAVRSLCYLGRYEPALEALNDSREKKYWPKEIEDLKVAVARSPASANAVRATIEAKRGADAPLLYRMLWSYSGEDLRRGGDRSLVDALEHSSLDVRALAFYTLQSITGLPPANYSPTDSDSARRTGLKRWQTELERKKIVPKAAAN